MVFVSTSATATFRRSQNHVLEAKCVSLVQVDHERDHLVGRSRRARIVDDKESVERGGLFDQIVIVAGLAPENGGFKRAFITQAICTAKPFCSW